MTMRQRFWRWLGFWCLRRAHLSKFDAHAGTDQHGPLIIRAYIFMHGPTVADMFEGMASSYRLAIGVQVHDDDAPTSTEVVH